MKTFYFLSAILLLSIFSCGQKSEPNITEENPLREKLLGTWQIKSMVIQMNSFRGTDSTAYFVVNQDAWEETMYIKPIITNLTKDGTYRSRYYDLSGKLIREAAGNWSVEKDSMIFIENNLRTAYHATVNDTAARFRAVIDWDRDGETDDLYEGIQLKVKN